MEQKAGKVVEIEKGISFGASSGTVFSVTKAEVEPDAVKKRESGSKPWAIWGSDNNFPQKLVDENKQEVASSGALRFKINAHFGQGPFFYRLKIDSKGVENRIPVPWAELDPRIKEFWWANDMANFQLGIVNDYEWFNHFNVEYIPNINRNKIVGVKWQRAINTRKSKRDPITGDIPNFHLSAKWPNPDDNQVAEVPAFNRLDPFAQPKGIYQHSLLSVDRDYYPDALWHSNMKWLKVANKIVTWINANLDNSVNIKYHVEIPEQYFIDLYPESRYETADACYAARKTAEAELKVKIDECLSGAENASKIFYTKFAVDQEGKVIPGWKITPIPNNLNDSAWLNGFSTAAAAIVTAHGVPPSLTNLVMSNNLNVGSGSDTREKFNFYMQLHTVIPRQITLEPFEFIKRFNKWPEDIHLGYKNIILQTIDKAKSGFETENEQSPTSDQQDAA